MIKFNDGFTAEDGEFRNNKELFSKLYDANLRIELVTAELKCKIDIAQTALAAYSEFLEDLMRLEFNIQAALNNRECERICAAIERLEKWQLENGYL